MGNQVVAVLLVKLGNQNKISSSYCVNKCLEEICRLAFTGVLDFEKRDDSNSPVSNFRQNINLPIQTAFYY